VKKKEGDVSGEYPLYKLFSSKNVALF